MSLLASPSTSCPCSPFLSTSLKPKPANPTRLPSSLSLSTKLRSYRFLYGQNPSFSSNKPEPGQQPDKKTNDVPDEWGEQSVPESDSPTKLADSDPPVNEDEWGTNNPPQPKNKIPDEWGERPESESEPETPTKLADSDPPVNEDEWGNNDVVSSVKTTSVVDGNKDLKRCLVDTVYGSGLGFRAGQEVRAEVAELVSQLEAKNPTTEPVQAQELLNGNWVLLYTAFSELLPLLAAGSTPLLKIERICQAIDTSNQTIVNSTELSSPFATFSFSASAAFEVRSPSRIQVEFKEGMLQPPEIKSKIDVPDSMDVFGQKINLTPVEQSLRPLQELVASISRVISGQPPLKVPIPGERTKSWLLTTYLDKDLRISRGDGGLFILAKEGSPLLDQY